MATWQHVFASVAHNVEEHFDALKYQLHERLQMMDPIVILGYRGYGTREALHVTGRVVENHGLTSAKDNDTVWQNLLNMYKRFATDEIPFARVRARFGDATQEAMADEEGYFRIELHPDPTLISDAQYWYEVEVELVEYPHPQPEAARTIIPVLVPPRSAEFAIISDLDDTVIKTDVLDLLKLARNVFLNNARTRLPFEGVAAFYQALQVGTRGSFNPIFYVSSSPWNLYDLITDFFEVRGIPQGSLFLTDMGLTDSYLLKPSRRKHKLDHIRLLLDMYPDLPFLLIGDSGEVDPEIYLQIVQEYPGRVRAIYIRDVSDEVRDQSITPIAEMVKASGSQLLLVKDTVAASVHASTHGYILPDALPAISQERSEDKKAPNPIERALDEATLG